MASMKRKETGARGEHLAAELLRSKSYHILETNYRCPHGEMDIIASLNGELVFVEVRTKSGTGFGTPEESVTEHKQNKLREVADYYCQEHNDLPENRRIDFIAVQLDNMGKPTRLEHFENAVGG